MQKMADRALLDLSAEQIAHLRECAVIQRYGGALTVRDDAFLKALLEWETKHKRSLSAQPTAATTPASTNVTDNKGSSAYNQQPPTSAPNVIVPRLETITSPPSQQTLKPTLPAADSPGSLPRREFIQRIGGEDFDMRVLRDLAWDGGTGASGTARRTGEAFAGANKFYMQDPGHETDGAA